jgi:hypothetical protein
MASENQSLVTREASFMPRNAGSREEQGDGILQERDPSGGNRTGMEVEAGPAVDPSTSACISHLALLHSATG